MRAPEPRKIWRKSHNSQVVTYDLLRMTGGIATAFSYLQMPAALIESKCEKALDVRPGGSRRPGAIIHLGNRDGDIAIHPTIKSPKPFVVWYEPFFARGSPGCSPFGKPVLGGRPSPAATFRHVTRHQ